MQRNSLNPEKLPLPRVESSSIHAQTSVDFAFAEPNHPAV
jgi:hypothetical protein